MHILNFWILALVTSLTINLSRIFPKYLYDTELFTNCLLFAPIIDVVRVHQILLLWVYRISFDSWEQMKWFGQCNVNESNDHLWKRNIKLPVWVFLKFIQQPEDKQPGILTSHRGQHPVCFDHLVTEEM